MHSPSNERLFAKLTRSIDAAATPREIEATLLQPIAHAIDADATALFELEVDNGFPKDVRDATLSRSIAGVLAPYRRSLFRDDPLYAAPSRQPAAMSAIMRDTCRPEIMAYYDSFLVPQGIGDIIGVHFPVTAHFGQRIFSVSFTRRTGSPSYSPREAQLLTDMIPLITLACSNVALREDLGVMQARLDELSASTARSHSERNWHRFLYRDSAAVDLLTGREREIAGLIYDGYTNLSIASLLSISVRTVENHLRNIYEKLGIGSRMQLAAWLRSKHATSSPNAPN